MNLRKLVTLVAAVFFMAMTSMAFAATQISTGDNSQPIPYASSVPNCNKGGDLSFKYERESLINTTDHFTMDLDLGVTLCKDVDLWLRIPADVTGGAGGSQDIISGVGVTNPEMWVRAWGKSGQRRINVRYYDNNCDPNNAAQQLVVGAVDTDFFRFALFNQKVDGTILKVPTAANTKPEENYCDQWTNASAFRNALIADNTLCIQHDPAVIAESQKLHFNLNRGTSSPNAFEFIGGKGNQPQIGHFISLTYKPVDCGKDIGRIECPEGTGQDNIAGAPVFDLESGYGYCDEGSLKHRRRALVIEAEPYFEVATDYFVTVRIKVNGNLGDNGVYFENNVLGYLTTKDRTKACNDDFTPLGVQRFYKYGDNTGKTTISSNPLADRFVRLESVRSGLGITGSEKYLAIDLPQFTADMGKVKAGDRVSVVVELRRDPCVIAGVFEKEIGIMCCDSIPEDASTELIYPYLTPMKDADWWCGVVVTNLSSKSGKATLDFYEQGGAKGTVQTPVINAYSMYVNLLENITVSGLTGNDALWMKAKTEFAADGFAMMGQASTGQSMGYLPRKPSYYYAQ